MSKVHMQNTMRQIPQDMDYFCVCVCYFSITKALCGFHSHMNASEKLLKKQWHMSTKLPL